MPVKVFDPKHMYFQTNEPKTMEDIRRERIITLWFVFILVALSIGLPLFVNLGKAIFEIQPIIY